MIQKEFLKLCKQVYSKTLASDIKPVRIYSLTEKIEKLRKRLGCKPHRKIDKNRYKDINNRNILRFPYNRINR